MWYIYIYIHYTHICYGTYIVSLSYSCFIGGIRISRSGYGVYISFAHALCINKKKLFSAPSKFLPRAPKFLAHPQIMQKQFYWGNCFRDSYSKTIKCIIIGLCTKQWFWLEIWGEGKKHGGAREIWGGAK
jgi:hypothetical protein